MGDLAMELGLNATTYPYTDDALGRLKVVLAKCVGLKGNIIQQPAASLPL